MAHYIASEIRTHQMTDKSNYPDIARKVAEPLVKKAVERYVAAVEKYKDEYTEPPSYDDFIAWLEGYDWPPAES